MKKFFFVKHRGWNVKIEIKKFSLNIIVVSKDKKRGVNGYKKQVGLMKNESSLKKGIISSLAKLQYPIPAMSLCFVLEKIVFRF